MIKISYNRTLNQTGVEVGDLTPIGEGPVKVFFKNIISNEIHLTQILHSNTWCKWSGAELITDVLVYTQDDKLIHHHKWDIVSCGDEIEKSLWFYLKTRKELNLKSNGLVIGTHDGRNGHWIYPIKHGLSEATLIDGSDKQYVELVNNYKNNIRKCPTQFNRSYFSKENVARFNVTMNTVHGVEIVQSS